MRRASMESYWWILAVAVLVTLLLAPFASSWPDGLERVAEDHGFVEKAVSLFAAPIPDYVLPGMAEKAGTAAAGALGVVVTFGAVWALSRLLAGPGHRP